MSKNKVNIYDVAEKADVGIGTVSRVLNNSDKVKDNTRKKVLEVMKELNYRPNKLAQNLARQKANAVAVIVPSFIDHFFVEVLKGIQDALEEENIDLILYKIDLNENRMKKIMDIVHSRKVDGIAALTMDISDTENQELKDSGIPVVLADEFSADFHSIYLDDLKGAEMAVDYLVNHNHNKIAFINGDINSLHGQKRLAGVKKSFQKHNLKINTDLIKDGDFYAEDGYQSMQEILELPRTEWPSAVFAASDNQAIGVLQAMEEKGLKAPDDIAVIGYDNIELAKYLKITTVWQPMYQLGHLAIEILLKAIKGELNEIYQKELELKLVKRETA
ncbi:LacI family DNA-binding transcriptional regulator [Halanaerobium congolense]|jgi:LacI family transcriptional regulator|uniref:LacI family DNA-binding transcriptional regulator n=1 Tax=Halanaerobium congolense TaxID=54121 RepID=UPI00079B31F9|nr:LacI family DNA-binding transcriptional regulator [Halanaerobium congolense]KXS49352.1 MAG: LacI family transcriptional regulator [Halanaerobium sp. T82-1]SDK43578.1 transcriptional regulator, LacI family [Halanaerobium congolense]SDN18006.1 transcriptional regulator, LacI family [Halanaerobium congolense]